MCRSSPLAALVLQDWAQQQPRRPAPPLSARVLTYLSLPAHSTPLPHSRRACRSTKLSPSTTSLGLRCGCFVLSLSALRQCRIALSNRHRAPLSLLTRGRDNSPSRHHLVLACRDCSSRATASRPNTRSPAPRCWCWGLLSDRQPEICTLLRHCDRHRPYCQRKDRPHQPLARAPRCMPAKYLDPSP